MNTSANKQQSEKMHYTVTGYNFTEMSKGKGSIEYQLMDDYGNERSVTAMANINVFKKVSNIRPIYKRELPLIKALSQVNLNDSIVVDFTEFNINNPRGSTGTQKDRSPSVKVNNTGDAQMSGVSSLVDSNMGLLLCSVIGVFAIWLMFF